MRIWLSAIFAAGMVAVGTPALATPEMPAPEDTLCEESSPPGTSFEIDGPGSNKFVGGWVIDGNHASLCYQGVGGAGGPTRVVAMWTTPWAEGGMEFEAAYSTLNPIDEVNVTIATRSKVEGDARWSRWFRLKNSTPSPYGGGGGGGGEDFAFLSPNPDFVPPRIRWQWRLEISIPGPVLVDGRASVSVH